MTQATSFSPTPPLRALTVLNECGDTTISWSEDRDAEMEAIIAKKMAEGVTFFIIEPRRGARRKLNDAADAMKHRALAIPDEDLRKFVEAGSGSAGPTPDEPVRGSRISRDPKEVAKSHAVAAKPRKGG
jgi:hypothetical protein